MDIIVGIVYKEDVGRVIEVIKKIFDEMFYVLVELELMVFVDNFGDSSVNIVVKVWVLSEKWFDVRW